MVITIKNKDTKRQIEEIKKDLNLSSNSETINYLIGFYLKMKKV